MAESVVRPISATCRFNTERAPALRGYFNELLSSGDIFSIDEWEDQARTYLATRNSEFGNKRGEVPGPEEFLHERILMYPTQPEPQTYQMYLFGRYSHLSNQLAAELGFSLSDLVSLEAFIYNSIMDRAEALDILDEHNTFTSKEEYADLEDFAVPTPDFQRKWAACIEFMIPSLIDDFLQEVERQNGFPESDLPTMIDNIYSMIEFLMVELQQENEYQEYQLFHTPLISLGNNHNGIIVPFPEILVKTAQIRFERLLERVGWGIDEEDSQKGAIVEEMVQEHMKIFSCLNFVNNVRYNDPHPRESDGLLLFEDSYWVVEIKGHPIFRRIPSDLEGALFKYQSKVKEAIDQGSKTLDYLEEDGQDLLFHLSGQKTFEDHTTGIIVVLDGFIPTLFSQNDIVDQLQGTGSLHEVLDDNIRVWVTSLHDLIVISEQIQEAHRLDEFLHWRTKYQFEMPAFAFNEREYWALYFDLYAQNPEFQEAFDSMPKDETRMVYISRRFNDKPYLSDDMLL